jgi:hypothetical protein
MTNPFTPLDGEKSRMRRCYDIVVSHEPGDVIPVEEVLESLNCDRGTALNSMRQAKAHLERDHLNSVEIVGPGNGGPAFGWRVLDRAARNLDVIDSRFAKTRRAQTRVVRLINNTERDRLDQFNRMRYDRQQASALRASALYDRRPASLMELQRKAEQQQRKQLPASEPETD